RTAINTVIQGSAADLIKQAMLNLSERLKQEQHPGRLLMQIHDELVFEVPLTELDTLGLIVREEMESAMDLDVPLIVDISSGLNWLEQNPLVIPHE
ncbi:MAG: DNA polymerase I, partial [Planctomycetaceae bacterium]|nr:DNA polymerase I [Planctomycetaceae bacterium]